MKSAPSIAFDYTPSRVVAASVVAIAALATVSPFLTEIPRVAAIAAGTIPPLVAFVALGRFMRPKFRRIARDATGWKLVDAEGIAHPCELAADVRFAYLIALDFRIDGGGRFRAIVGPDNLDRDTLRRLVLRLARGEVAQAG
jgi:toxin CptA